MEFLRGRMADAEEALKEARAEMEGVDKCVGLHGGGCWS